MTEQTVAPATEVARDFTLAEIADVVGGVCEYLGWYEDARTLGEDYALLHSEISEALEAYRQWGYDDATGEYVGHAAEFPEGLPPLKPEGVGSELADVVIRLLDMYRRRIASLEFDEPIWWSSSIDDVHPAVRVGASVFGDQVAELHYLVAVGRLGEVLPYVRRVAELANIDVFTEVQRKIAFNVTRGHRHGGKRL